MTAAIVVHVHVRPVVVAAIPSLRVPPVRVLTLSLVVVVIVIRVPASWLHLRLVLRLLAPVLEVLRSLVHFTISVVVPP